MAQVFQFSTDFQFFCYFQFLLNYSLQEKAANARMHASNTIKYTMGPTGTIVTFPEEMGFPSLFNSKPVRY